MQPALAVVSFLISSFPMRSISSILYPIIFSNFFLRNIFVYAYAFATNFSAPTCTQRTPTKCAPRDRPLLSGARPRLALARDDLQPIIFSLRTLLISV
jgi:hypothetical protein